MKKVCLITPGHISTNPRLVKEAIALSKAGFKVHLVFTQYVHYLVKEDLAILQKNSHWSYDALDWTGRSAESRFHRYKSGILQKLGKRFYRQTGWVLLQILAINRHYSWQLQAAKRSRSDLYIGHNLGALPVVRQAAKELKAFAGFDAEDFHRFETSDDISDPDVNLKKSVEDLYLKGLDHLTAASPLIAEEYEKLYQENLTSILNVFPKENAQRPTLNEHEPLKLFWFSQRLGRGRGIEEVLKAINGVKDKNLELHLLGELSQEDENYFKELIKQYLLPEQLIHMYSPVSPDEIFSIASKLDIGLATETGKPYNRDICLTNKIFTYIQAGLAVIASDTKAQVELINEYPQIGVTYKRNSIATLTAAINFYQENRQQLNETKRGNYDLGQTRLSWETESKIYISKIQGLLN